MVLNPKKIELEYMLQSSGLPKQHWKEKSLALLDRGDEENYKILKTLYVNMDRFVEDGRNLFICSKNVGNGKTSWAIKLMQSFFKKVWAGNGMRTRALFVNVPMFLTRLKDFDNPLDEDYLYCLMNCDLVIWDDIAFSERLTEFEYNKLLTYIDYRVFNVKANIYTSNVVSREEVSKVLGARLTSRVYNTSKVLELKSKDFRGITL